MVPTNAFEFSSSALFDWCYSGECWQWSLDVSTIALDHLRRSPLLAMRAPPQQGLMSSGEYMRRRWFEVLPRNTTYPLGPNSDDATRASAPDVDNRVDMLLGRRRRRLWRHRVKPGPGASLWVHWVRSTYEVT